MVQTELRCYAALIYKKWCWSVFWFCNFLNLIYFLFVLIFEDVRLWLIWIGVLVLWSSGIRFTWCQHDCLVFRYCRNYRVTVFVIRIVVTPFERVLCTWWESVKVGTHVAIEESGWHWTRVRLVVHERAKLWPVWVPPERSRILSIAIATRGVIKTVRSFDEWRIRVVILLRRSRSHQWICHPCFVAKFSRLGRLWRRRKVVMFGWHRVASARIARGETVIPGRVRSFVNMHLKSPHE